jgi:hypothetical protein
MRSFLLTLFLIALASANGPYSSAQVTLSTTTTTNATGPLTAGQSFNYVVNFSWSNADYGTHSIKIDITIPPGLDFVSTSPSGGALSNGVVKYTHPSFTVPGPATPFTTAPKGSGSSTVTLTLRVKQSSQLPSQACVSGSISDLGVSAQVMMRCVDIHCLCTGVVSAVNLTGQPSSTAVLLDLGNLGSSPCGNASACSTQVANRIAQLTPQQRQQMESQACSMNVQPGTVINAFAKFGTSATYTLVRQVGVLSHATTNTCTCPPGWTSNTSGVVGGVTTDQKCKKQVATLNIAPLPPNTTISTWGFTVGNAVWVWGTTANGGAPNCVSAPATPPVCKIQ